MAVEDKYINSDVASEKKGDAFQIGGAKVIAMVCTFEVAAADDDGSVYRLFKGLSPDLVPIKIEINNDAITGGTDYDLGIYKTGIGAAAKDQDVLAAAMSMASAAANGSEKNGLAAVAIDSLNKRLYELAGDTIANKEGSYDIAITAVTVGTAAGTITVRAYFIQG